MASKVKALYNYSYEYEGSQISFTCGEEFQLLNKANSDWWQVRKWLGDGSSKDIYVPANYVKELESGSKDDPLYQNMTDIVKAVEEIKRSGSQSAISVSAKEQNGAPGGGTGSSSSGPVRVVNHEYEMPQVIVKARPSGKKKDPLVAPNSPARSAKHPVGGGTGARIGGAGGSSASDGSRTSSGTAAGPDSSCMEPKPSISVERDGPSMLSSSTGTTMAAGIQEGWIAGYALPKPRSKSVMTDSSQQQQKQLENGTADDNKPSPLTLATLDNAPERTLSGGKQKIPPPPPAKPKKRSATVARPNSMADIPVNLILMKDPGLTSMSSSASSSSFPASSSGGRDSHLQHSARHMTHVSHEYEVIQPKSVHSSGGGSNKGVSPLVLSDEKPLPNTGGSSMMSGGVNSLPRDTVPPPGSPLPEGWTRHKTTDGKKYYYNSSLQQSSWVKPLLGGGTTNSSPSSSQSTGVDHLERIAPCGWTKEINPLNSIPIYTNCINGEKWTLGKDASGNYYYYNIANPTLTVGELPSASDGHSFPNHMQDRVSPPRTGESELLLRQDPRLAADEQQHTPTIPLHFDLIASSMSNVLNKHGYLSKKRLFDTQGKRVKGSWQKEYVSLSNHQLNFYKDHKTALDTPSTKPLSIFSLPQAQVFPYNKDRKKYAFQISSSFGEQFVLQADNQQMMNDWYTILQNAIERANIEYSQHPERFRDTETSPVVEDSGESSPRIGFKPSFHRRKESKDVRLDDDDEVEDAEMMNPEKSARIRTRLKKLVAKRPNVDTLKKSGILEYPVFGCELSELLEREKSDVPKFFVKFMDHIERNGLSVVGIYRLSGNAALVNKLRYMVEQDQPYDLRDPQWSDINIVTGCLKLYLRELPDPLIPFKQFRSFIDAARCSPSQRAAALTSRVKDIPTANYKTLKALMLHLRRVMDHGSTNKMQSTNLAIVFGPTIMRAEMDTLEMATLMPLQNCITELMITDFDSIFRK